MYKLAATISVGFFVFILWVIYLANTGGHSIFFDFVKTIPGGDKLGHAVLFGFLTLVAIIGLRFRLLNIGGLKIYSGATAVVLFVVCEELSQAFIASRTFDLLDLGADLAGISLAVAIAFIASRYLAKRSCKDSPDFYPHNVPASVCGRPSRTGEDDEPI